MSRIVGKLQISRGTQWAMVVGAFLGSIFAVSGANAPVVYGVGIGTGVAFCLLEEILERKALRRDERRRR